jgi:hypothetical protein
VLLLLLLPAFCSLYPCSQPATSPEEQQEEEEEEAKEERKEICLSPIEPAAIHLFIEGSREKGRSGRP